MRIGILQTGRTPEESASAKQIPIRMALTKRGKLGPKLVV